MNILFWQNIVSPHQAGFMRAIAEGGHRVTVIAEESMSAGRQRLGWEPPALGSANLTLAPSYGDVKRIVCESDQEAIHCIAGARVTGLGSLVAKECRAARRRMGIISETPDPRGPGGLLRWGKYALERLTIGRHFDFVLAMGETGVRWFRNCGYPAERVFPFCYVTEVAPQPDHSQASNAFRLLFVGRLVDLKGVDVLLKALAKTAGPYLDVVGDGPCRETWQRLSESLGLESRVRWMGQLPPAAVAPAVARADAIVLPSRKDGWGAVVNEALMLGTPVICSSACGASDLIRQHWLGTVFNAGDVQSLQLAIAQRASKGSVTLLDRNRIRDWASCIAAASIAAYMEAVFCHVYEGRPRPIAPWRAG